jgi:hypothetical protein
MLCPLNPRSSVFICGSILLALAMAACQPATAPPPPATTAPLPTVTPAATPEPALTPGAPAPVVGELDAGVEAVFTQIPDGDWGHAAATVDGMTTAWYAHGVDVAMAGAPQATLNSIDAALADLAAQTAAQNADGALQSANLVSAAVADLYDLYLPPPTADLRRLTMLERQLWLDSAQSDPQVIQGDFAQLQSIWGRVADSIRQSGGEAFADQFEASLATQAQYAQANDTAGLRAEAGQGMRLVALLR